MATTGRTRRGVTRRATQERKSAAPKRKTGRSRKGTRRKPQRPEFLSGHLDIDEAAQLSGRDRSWIWRMVREGRPTKSGRRIYLEAADVGGRLYVTEQALLDFVERCARANRTPTTEEED